MDPDIKLALDRFITEVRKDLWFFGGCGAVVGLFTVWQSRLKELGIAQNPRWASDLFSDFMSFNAFGLVFFGYLLIACISTVFASLGHARPKLELAVSHMESRLAQIASAIVCFMAGLLALVVVYSILNLDSGGAKLAALTVLFAIFIVGSFVMALAVGRRTKPFDTWWVALVSIFLLAGILGWLLVQGGK